MTNTDTLPATQQIGSNVTFQCDKDILIYTMTASTREAVDCFVDHAKNIYNAQPTGTNMYLMTDTSGSSTSSLSPYFRKRIEELTAIAVSRELKVMVAVILPKSYMFQIAMFFVQKLALGGSQVRFFFARQDGIAWLEATRAKQAS